MLYQIRTVYYKDELYFKALDAIQLIVDIGKDEKDKRAKAMCKMLAKELMKIAKDAKR